MLMTVAGALCAVVLAAPVPSQAAAADPITGAWNGEMWNSRLRHVVNLEVKLDGRVVTGVLEGPSLTPGDLREGTFDATTGAIRFDVHVRGGTLVVRFEGRLTDGEITGRVAGGDESGEFKLMRGKAATGAGTPSRQAVDPATAAVRRGFAEVSGWVTRAAELVPADRYSYRPVGTVRTFGQQVAHVADSYAYYCGRGAGRSVEWSDAVEKGAQDTATLTRRLKQALDGCATVYAGSAQIGPLLENVAHTSLHYGNMVTYLRMLGLTPPSS
jgi:hypothetical protein